MQPAPIRVYLVDDHLSLLQLLALHIDAAPDLELVGTSTDGQTAVEEVVRTKPAVVVLDVEIPGRGVFDVAVEIKERHPFAGLIFFTGYISDIFLEQALRVGARGYVLKGESVQTLVECIRRVAAGDFCFSSEAEQRMQYDSRAGQYALRSQSDLAALTTRQLEVLRHLARGSSVKEIARTMHLSEKSIDSHKYRIMNKLGIHDRVELARYAIREGLTLP